MTDNIKSNSDSFVLRTFTYSSRLFPDKTKYAKIEDLINLMKDARLSDNYDDNHKKVFKMIQNFFEEIK